MQSKRSNSKVDKENNFSEPSFISEQWNVPEKHMIHLQAKRIIGSGSFGKSTSVLMSVPGYVFEAFDSDS